MSKETAKNNDSSSQSGGVNVGGDIKVDGDGNTIGDGNMVENHFHEAPSLEKDKQLREETENKSVAQEALDVLKEKQDVLKSEIQKTDSSNPYKALDSYELKDASHFYGREQAVIELFEKVTENKLTILYSDSGSGKTSLLNAGLTPRLLNKGDESNLPIYCRPINETPQSCIKKKFIKSFDPLREEYQRFNSMSLREFLGIVTENLATNKKLYIFLDQFEEFSQLKHKERKLFLQELNECRNDDGLRVHWVLAFRLEFFGRLNTYDQVDYTNNKYFLNTFNIAEATEVITEPAKSRSVTYEEGLVAQIIDDLKEMNEVNEGDDDDSEEIDKLSPAQVQIVCHTLFEELQKQDAKEIITFELYNKERGRDGEEKHIGVQGILKNHLATILDEFHDEKPLASLVLEELVTSEPRRDRVQEDELIENLKKVNKSLEKVNKQKIEEILNALISKRLIRQANSSDGIVYELTHDYLLKEIDLEPEVKKRKRAQELLEKELWSYQNHESNPLLSEETYKILISQKNVLTINDDAEELFEQSRIAIQRAKFKLYGSLSAACLFFFATIIAALLFFSQKTRAEDQTVLAKEQTKLAEEQTVLAIAQKTLANAKTIQQGNQLQLSSLLALISLNKFNSTIGLESAPVEDSIIAKDILRQNLTKLPEIKSTIADGSGIIYDITFSHNGGLVATAYDSREVIIHDVINDEQLLPPLKHSSAVRSVVFSPDNSLIATGDENAVHLWNVESRDKFCTLPHNQNIQNVLFSPDDTWLATTSWGGDVRLWNIEAIESLCEAFPAEVTSTDNCTLHTQNGGGENNTDLPCDFFLFNTGILVGPHLAFSQNDPDHPKLLFSGESG